MIDCHCHTKFSPDSFTDPEDEILAAIKKGLKHITITEHMDFPYSVPFTCDGEKTFTCDITNDYYDGYVKLREKYKDKITITIGVEIGYTEVDLPYILKELAKRPYEYTISSIHIVDGLDIYWPRYYEGKTKEKAYLDYLEKVKKSLEVPYHIDAIGHLGYIARYSTYENKDLTYEEFPHEIDEILNLAIKKNIFLELNSKTYNGEICLPHPSIIKRYFDMGGRLITFGSDSHSATDIGNKYNEVKKLAKDIGFKYFVYKESNETKKETLD